MFGQPDRLSTHLAGRQARGLHVCVPLSMACVDLWEELYPNEITQWRGHSCGYKKQWGQCESFLQYCARTCGACGSDLPDMVEEDIDGGSPSQDPHAKRTFFADIAREPVVRLLGVAAANLAAFAVVLIGLLWLLGVLRRKLKLPHPSSTRTAPSAARMAASSRKQRYTRQLDRGAEDEDDEESGGPKAVGEDGEESSEKEDGEESSEKEDDDEEESGSDSDEDTDGDEDAGARAGSAKQIGKRRAKNARKVSDIAQGK